LKSTLCFSPSFSLSAVPILTKPNQEGDLILTGTPSGVGPVVPGDQVECLLADAQGEELIKLDFTAVQREGGYRFQSEE
jgi:acylpyruvate hydrolase